MITLISSSIIHTVSFSVKTINLEDTLTLS